MYIRKAELTDLEIIMKIYAAARRFMAEHGNPRQWGNNNWPPEELIRNDIENGDSYVCVEKDEIAAVFFYKACHDTTYDVIEQGAWLDDSPYAVVHRIASSGKVKGVGAFCLDWAYKQSGHLRMDTHGDNVVMQNMLKKQGFCYCGIIYVEEDNDPRLAFEKVSRER